MSVIVYPKRDPLGDMKREELDENGEIEAIGQKLDLYYIPACYPDAFMEGAPFEYFEESQAKEAVEFAETLIRIVYEKIP